MGTRTVRFFELMRADQKGEQRPFASGWWTDSLADVALLSVSDREVTYRDTRYIGEARNPSAPATPYLYFGRLRARQDFPDSYRRGVGIEGPLELGDPSRQLSEGTYVVPFGSRNYVAVMSMQGTFRIPPLAYWLNSTFGYITQDESLDLMPVVDAELQRKLGAAVGASRVQVRLAPDQDAEGIVGPGGDALRAAGELAPEEAFVELALSFGQGRRGSEGAMDSLLLFARQLYGRRMKTAEVSLQFNVDGDLHAETHNLLIDKVSRQVSVPNDVGSPASESAILHAIGRASDDFTRRRGDS